MSKRIGKAYPSGKQTNSKPSGKQTQPGSENHSEEK